MPGILNTSLTGMLAFQRALSVTSHNIANASTPGYSRQVVEFSARSGTRFGNGYIGGGTQITTIKRIYDELLAVQLQSSTTSQVRFGTLNGLAGQIDIMLADADTGLNRNLQSFFNSMQDLNSDPASISTRQVLLSEATALADRFRTLHQRLGSLDVEVNTKLQSSVADINNIAASIADVNDKIANVSGGPPPNDLLDHRDRLLLALSEHVAVTTTRQDNGAMNVFIGSGQSLVIGNQVQELGLRSSEFDPTRLIVVYEGAAGTASLDKALTGGALGGLLEFRSKILDPAMQSLGQTAVALAAQFNEQHQSGMDLRGDLGGAFFGIDPPAIMHSSNNTGSGDATAMVSDLGSYTGANYVLTFDGAAYSVVREDSGTPVAMTGTGTPADPFIFDGIAIEVSGTPAAGDKLLIKTGQDAAGSIVNLISDPQSIAMAAPTRSLANFGNTGSATISPATVSDRSDPALLTSSTIQFTSPTSYTINGVGSFSYSDGDPIKLNGTTFSISGSPQAGDQFTIEANFGATGDNSNGLDLTGIQSLGLLGGGAISINENYSLLVSSVGGTTHQIQANLDAQNVVLRNAQDTMLSKSAVNLDEEAANLIRYQQAFQAVAQVVRVAQSLFDTLLNATAR